jgi:branched-chain amino acid transport system substrate-binding protein
MTHMRPFLALILLILATRSPAVAESTSNLKLKVGILASFADEWAPEGKNIIQGTQLAAEEINLAGGVLGQAIVLVPEDTQEANSGAKAVSAYRKLRQQNVSFFIGPAGTPAGMSLAPIIAREQVLIITPLVGVREFSDSAKNIFNARGVDDANSRSMAKFAIDHGWRRASVICSQQAWESAQGRAFRDEFEKLGGQVVAFEEPLPNALDLRTPLTKLLAPKPDVVFMSNANRMPLAAKELLVLGYKGPKLTTLIDDSMAKQALGSLDGAIFTDFGDSSTEFTSKYQKRFGEKPGLGTNTAYDALMALASAINTSKSFDPVKVSQTLATISIPGSSGAFSFDPSRLARRSLVRFQIVNSEIRKLQ